MKVDKSRARTCVEEYERLVDIVQALDCHLPWDLHPNVMRNQIRYRKKLVKQIIDIIDSEEGREYKLYRIL